MNRLFHRTLTDLDAPKGAHLMGPHEEGSLNIVMLLLSGRATPYLHNGVIYVGDEDHYVRVRLRERHEVLIVTESFPIGFTTIRHTFACSHWLVTIGR